MLTFSWTTGPNSCSADAPVLECPVAAAYLSAVRKLLPPSVLKMPWPCSRASAPGSGFGSTSASTLRGYMAIN